MLNLIFEKMQVSIKMQGLSQTLKKLDNIQAEQVLRWGLNRLHARLDNRLGLEARETVYSYKPITQGYERTGRLLGGRGRSDSSGGKPYSEVLNPETIKVEANPMIKGAKFNYAPSVNDGTGAMSFIGPRPFWNLAVDWAENEGKKQTYKEMKNKIKQNFK